MPRTIRILALAYSGRSGQVLRNVRVDVRRAAYATGVSVTWPNIYFELQVDYATRQIAVRGEFDVATASCLGTAVAAFERVADGDITIDLGDVTFIDAAGLNAVANASSEQAGRGSGLRVTGASADVRRAFVLSKLAELLEPAPGQG